MKYLFTLCLLVFTLSASAQWQQTGAKVRYVNGLGIPTRDTAAGVAADSSQILIRPADSSLYVKYKRTWVKVGGGSVSGTPNRVSKFTGATTVGNSSIVDSASAVAMTITPSGSIGIGTNPVSSKLEVNGGIRTSDKISSSTSNANGTATIGTFFNNANITQFVNNQRVSNATEYGFMQGSDGKNYIGGSLNIVEHGRTLIGTTTDNGVDRVQVSGSMNVSARATAQTLSVTGNATLEGTTLLKGRTTVNPSGTTVFTDRLFEISGTAGTTGSTQFAFVQNPTFGTPTTVYSWYNSLNVTSATTSYGLYYDTEGGSITNKWGLYFVGGSRNYLANTLLISTTTDNNTDKLQVNGSIQGTGFNQAYTAKTGTYTATTTDYFIDCTSGTFTVNLFTAVGNTGRILIIKNSGTGTITVDPNGSQTIDGATTQTLSTQWSRVHIISDGTNWKIISL